MSIDRIGKPPAPAPAPTVGATQASAPFEVAAPGGAGAAASVDAASPELDRLRSGELDRAGYVEARVDAALEPLRGRLAPDQLELVRSTLVEQMETDPVLVELLRQAAGPA
ncbi:MAG: hypothetical protein IT376_18920 [Polyangiaceae bacterium]|nr:hypothetical protein [Polyangiaceae bacterium]